MACNLYRSIWLGHLGGYVVYRHDFDESRCAVEQVAAVRKTAVFVDDVEARHYCKYRNRLIDRNGTDAIFVSQPVKRAGRG